MPFFDTHPVNLSGNWLARSNRRRVVEKQFLSVEDNCFCLAGEGWDYLWFANAPTFSRRRSFKMVVGGQILHQIKIVFQLSYDFDYAQRIFNVRVLSNPRTPSGKCMHRKRENYYSNHIFITSLWLVLHFFAPLQRNLLLKHLFLFSAVATAKKSFRSATPEVWPVRTLLVSGRCWRSPELSYK